MFLAARILMFLLLLSNFAYGQSNGGFVPGQTLGAAQLNEAFSRKCDYPCAASAILGISNTWTALQSFNVGATVPTLSCADNSINVASTAYALGCGGGTFLNNAPPFTTACNPTGITAVAQWCAAITAVPPLGISGSALNTDVDPPLHNVFIGTGGARAGLSTANENVGVGFGVLSVLTTGTGNMGLGGAACFSVSSGANNVCMGTNAGVNLGIGVSNVAIGTNALATAASGQTNVAIGQNSLALTTVSNNVGVGYLSGNTLTTGGQNTFVGSTAGQSITTGSNNSVFGRCTGLAAALANAIVLCDGAGSIRYDWGSTTAATATLAGPVNVTGALTASTTLRSSTIYSAAGTPLPTCNGAAEGTWAAVSDATGPTYAANYTSGGTVHVPVYCNGTNWITP